MNELPWWSLSPSPFTWIQWIGLTLLGGYILGDSLDLVVYKKNLARAMLILGFVVFLSDAMWVLLSWIRWGTLYPSSRLQLLLCFIRDIYLAFVCYFVFYMVNDKIGKAKIEKTDMATSMLWLANIVFLVLWFMNAETPGDTDWTFAIRHGYAWSHVWSSFFVSHIVGRVITAGIYVSMIVK